MTQALSSAMSAALQKVEHTQALNGEEVATFYQSALQDPRVTERARLLYYSTGKQDNNASVPEGIYLKLEEGRKTKILLPLTCGTGGFHACVEHSEVNLWYTENHYRDVQELSVSISEEEKRVLQESISKECVFAVMANFVEDKGSDLSKMPLPHNLNTDLFRKDYLNKLLAPLEYRLQAADQGNIDAMCSIGVIYEEGKGGVSQDLQKAREWYAKAAEQGNKVVHDSLNGLYEQELKKREGIIKDTFEIHKKRSKRG